MFGYVIADREIMTEEQVGRYRAYYCGPSAARSSAGTAPPRGSRSTTT